jgi:hypothetical protein
MAAIVILPAFGLGYRYTIKAGVSRLANSRFVLGENSSSKQSYTQWPCEPHYIHRPSALYYCLSSGETDRARGIESMILRVTIFKSIGLV